MKMRDKNTPRTEELGGGLRIYVAAPHVFTSDPLLLSRFSAPKNGEKICDFGSGCGIIPLLAYRDSKPAENVGVEISGTAVSLFTDTLKLNGIGDEVECVHADLRELGTVFEAGRFDLITMNPPYKKRGAGIVGESQDERNARHEYTCSFEEAAVSASRLLRFGGRFCVCQRPERLCDMLCAMRESGIEPKVLREVVQRRGGEPSLVLIEGRRGGNPGMRIRPVLYIENENGEYSPEAADIFEAYKRIPVPEKTDNDM